MPTLPTTFEPLAPESFGPGARVHRGSTAGQTGERDLLNNANHLHGYVGPQIVATHFSSETYVEGAGGGAVVHGSWRRRVFRDLTTVRVTFYASNTGAASPADDATVEFRLASEGPGYADATKKLTTTVPAAAAAWTKYTGTFAYTPGLGTYDTIEMTVANGAAGVVRVRSVSVWLEPLGSITTTITTEGVVTFEDAETAEDAPLTVYLRQTEFNNLDILRRTRTPTIIGWSEDAVLRVLANAAYRTQSANYSTIAKIPFRSIPGCTALEWSLAGYRTGASGSVTLQTGWMKAQGIAAITTALGNAASWAAPYPFTDDGGSTLTTIETANDYIEVQIKSDGAGYTYLMGLNVWPEDVAA